VDILISAEIFSLLGSAIEPLFLKWGWIQDTEEIIYAINLNWYSFAWTVLYFGLSAYVGKGRTPGKALLGIRIESLVHPRISLWQSIERALGYAASLLEFGFGYFQYFFHPNRRTVHDRIAETIVVRQRRKRTPASAPAAPLRPE
jgi:uncharacterized RDD family membrane protein YckC